LLTLRPLRAEDEGALYAVASDPLLWAQHPVPTRYELAVFREFFAEAMVSGGALIAEDVETGAVVGSSRFHGYDAERRELEIGWSFLARSHWGGRFNREMKRLMLGHAFTFVDRVIFLVGPGNLRSQAALRKIGAAGVRHEAARRRAQCAAARVVRPSLAPRATAPRAVRSARNPTLRPRCRARRPSPTLQSSGYSSLKA
jgi:RimJ/RimL family protein N-acetyltransferase